jgi:hypothetical protein
VDELLDQLLAAVIVAATAAPIVAPAAPAAIATAASASAASAATSAAGTTRPASLMLSRSFGGRRFGLNWCRFGYRRRFRRFGVFGLVFVLHA